MHLGPALFPFLAAASRHRAHPGAGRPPCRRLGRRLRRRGPARRARGFAPGGLAAGDAASALLVASPDYLARHGRPASLEALAGHKAIYYLNRGVADWRFLEPARQPLRASCVRPAGQQRRPDARRRPRRPGHRAVAQLHRRAGVEDRPLEGGGCRSPSAAGVHLCGAPEGRRASAKLRALVDSLRQAFGDPPYWDLPS